MVEFNATADTLKDAFGVTSEKLDPIAHEIHEMKLLDSIAHVLNHETAEVKEKLVLLIEIGFVWGQGHAIKQMQAKEAQPVFDTLPVR